MITFISNILTLPFKFCFNFFAVILATPFAFLWLLKERDSHFITDTITFAFDSIMDFDY